MSYKILLPISGTIIEGNLVQKSCPYCTKDDFASASTSHTTLCCDIHLDTVHGLSVVPCRAFPKKGLGLYATRNFKTSELIARTRGELIFSERGLNDIYGFKNDCAPYAIRISPIKKSRKTRNTLPTPLPFSYPAVVATTNPQFKIVDELADRSPCAYANDPTDIDHFNCLISNFGMSTKEAYDRSLLSPESENAYMSSGNGLRPALYAMRDIHPGDEIMWKYGYRYWEPPVPYSLL